MQDKLSHSQDNQPLISYIVPTYNMAGNLLCECIESICALSLSAAEREIILVDDGSEHTALNDIGELKDTILYIRQNNGGLSIARNTGLRMARGKYIQFVDADDKLLQQPYEHCLDIVRYQKADVVVFDFTNSETADGMDYADRERMSGIQFMSHYNIRGTAWGYLFKRSLLGELRFTPGIYHEDEEFTPLLLLRADSVVATNAKAYFYRKREASIVNSSDTRSILKRLNDGRDVIFRLNSKADRLPTAERIALQRRVAQLTMDYIYKVIIETRNKHYLDRQLRLLEKEGLYPLPDKNYTTKYTWFRRMANSELGLKMLFGMLPHTKRER